MSVYHYMGLSSVITSVTKHPIAPQLGVLQVKNLGIKEPPC